MSSEILRFEDFELDRGAYQLRRSGQVVHLERIPLDLLFLLVERRGQLVTRNEIVERIWGKGVFIDSDNGINAAVRKLRRALNDDPAQPQFIGAIHGKGYRFVAQVREDAARLAQGTPTHDSLVDCAPESHLNGALRDFEPTAITETDRSKRIPGVDPKSIAEPEVRQSLPAAVGAVERASAADP